MPHLTAEQKADFKENGCLILRDVVPPDVVTAAQDALWEGIDADRDDPETWVEAGPRNPAPGHEAIRATVHASPLFEMMEEMVGKDTLHQGSPGPALVFPSRDKEWMPARGGHLDGYYTPTNGVPEGTVGYMTINVTIYVEQIEERGGCFTYWPGSHRVAHEFFKNHSLLSVPGGNSRHIYPEGEHPPGEQFTGKPGDAIFWHGQLIHSGSKNVNRNIRMALIGRFSRKDSNNFRFETNEEMWTRWEGIE